EPLLEDLGTIDLEGIHWVILGGESGHGARPTHRDWVLSVRDQCERAGIPFFFKQWGGVRKSKAGRELDGRTYDGVPGRLSLPVLEPRDRLAAIPDIEGGDPASSGDRARKAATGFTCAHWWTGGRNLEHHRPVQGKLNLH